MYLRLSPYCDVLQGVLTSLQVNEGIIKITGHSGAGKTALCSQLFHELEAAGQPAVFFLKPPGSAIALQNDILDNLHLDPTGNFTRTLTAYLLARTAAQAPLVLIFDDAQQLDAQTFGAIRMLCNIQDQSRGLVRVVLCGNDELNAKLESPALRAVTQFLNQSFTLPYLTQDQVKDFCQGYWQSKNQDMKPLSQRSLQKLFQETRGRPGILQARLNQGTTGVEQSDRYREAGATPKHAPPFKYAGRHPGWLPALLIITGLLLIGGAGAWYLLGLPPATDNASGASVVANEPAAANATPPLAPPPIVTTVTAEPEPEVIAPQTTTATATAAAEVEVSPVAEETTIVASTGAAERIDDVAAESAANAAGSAQPEPDRAVASESAQRSDANLTGTASALPPVEPFIAEWTASWQEQDVDAYFEHYHPDFTPAEGVTREAWREQRRRVIENAVNIVIAVDAPEFTGDTADGARIVRFWLHYSAGNYADRTLKELLLTPVDGMWRIRAESNLRTERL